MGSVMRVFTATAEHIVAQSQVDAGRIKQKAYNDSQLSLADSKRILQTANNAASDIYAANAAKLQAANNAGATAMQTGQLAIQGAQNTANKQIADAQRTLQGTFNEQAILVAEAQKTVQAARNERVAQDTTTALWGQSLKNQRILDAAGERVGQITEDAIQVQDRTLRGRVFDRIEASQMLGATVAQAAVSGVGGSSVDMLKDALQLQQGLKEATIDDQLHQQVVRAYKERGNTMATAVGSLDFSPIVANMDHEAITANQNFDAISDNQDFSPIFANIDYSPIIADHDYSVFTPDQDYTVYVDHHKMSTFAKVATLVTAGVATYYGGPQAGAAVVDASMAMQDAQNLNFSGAQSGMNNAFKNAMGGFDTYRAGASGSSSGQAWGKSIFTNKTNAGASFKG